MTQVQVWSMVSHLTRRDFRLRYLGASLGGYWNIIHPLVMILIYTLVFSGVMKARLGDQGGLFSYGLYLCSGILAWTAFAEVVQRSVATLLENSGFLKKIPFPPLLLFGSVWLTAVINYSISFSLYLVFAGIAGNLSPLLALTSLGVALLLLLMGSGIGILMGCLNVFVRDIQQMVNVVIQLWFWFTPIVYLVEQLPAFAKPFMVLNPAFVYINSLHDLLFYQKLPPMLDWVQMMVTALVTLVLGLWVYSRSVHLIRDEL